MKKFNILDLFIVLIIVVVGIVGVRILLKASGASNTQKTEKVSKVIFTVEESSATKEIVNAIKVGDEVSIGVNQIDSCIVTDVNYEPADENVFDGTTGAYKKVKIPEQYRLKVTCEAKATVTDMEIKVGETAIRVGTWFGLRGKGYAVTGYIIESELEE